MNKLELIKKTFPFLEKDLIAEIDRVSLLFMNLALIRAFLGKVIISNLFQWFWKDA